MTSKELIAKLDSHMRVNKITRKSVADKLGVSSAEVGRKLAADNCWLREFLSFLDAVGSIWLKPNTLYSRTIISLSLKIYNIGIEEVSSKLETTPAKVKRMLASENMKLSTFLKLTEAAGVTNDYFKLD